MTTRYRGVPLAQLGWRRAIALFELSVGGRASHYARAEITLAGIARDLAGRRADHLILSGDITAYAMEEEDSRKAIDAGCTGYLSKPFQREQLFAILREAVPSLQVPNL